MSLKPPVDLRPYFLTLDDLSGPLDWVDFFGNDHPVEVEAGTGRGLFLVNAGEQHPETNFLGIELSYKEGRRAARRLQKRKMPHVRILGADAKIVLRDFIPSDSVSVVHVYFPDPWWKRRHKKRRLFTAELVKDISRILHTGGLLHVWTDVEEYFRVMTDLVAARNDFSTLPPPKESAPEHDMDYHTSFERKKRKLGLPIYRSTWERNA